MGLFSLPAPAGYRAHPSGLLELDSRSGELIVPTKYEMALPTSDAELVAQGWPSILGAVDGELWLCDEAAGSLVGEVNGYQLAPQNAPLQNRDFHGLPYAGSLWGKKAVECTATGQQRFQDATAADCDVGTDDFSISLLVRSRSVWLDAGGGVEVLASKRVAAGNWWQLSTSITPGTSLEFTITDASGFTVNSQAINLFDGALHLLTVACDRNGNVSWYFDGAATVTNVAGRPGDIDNAGGFALGSISFAGNYAPALQYAWVYHVIGVAASRVGHDALWAALSSNHLGTPNTYARTNPLTVPISASRVATYAANQFAVGYDAGFAAGDNALETGVVCEDAATLQGIRSQDLANWSIAGNTISPVDGPSGMHDAIRVLQAAGGWDFTHIAYRVSPIAGASNVAWVGGCLGKVATTGATIITSHEFLGDGGGPEAFGPVVNAATAADWQQYWGTCTPVRPAHNSAYFEVGAPLNGDDVDFAEPYMVQGRATPLLGWRRCGDVSAATSTPTLSYTNVGNARYNPARGRLRLRIADFQGDSGAFFLGFGVAGAAGSLALSYNAGALILRIWDDVAALVDTLSCGAINTAEHTLDVAWDATAGTMSVMEGATVLGASAPGVWVPEPTDVTPIAVGSDVGGNWSSRALVTLCNIWNY